jgi:Tfp pilus assembly protein PilN
MRAVNLIPQDSRRRGLGGMSQSVGAAYALVALLAVAVLFVTIDVLTSNTISNRKVKLTALTEQTANAKATATSLEPYVTFAQLAQARTTTVRTIAAARFDWNRALIDLARVVPANTSLSAIDGSVAPGAGSGSTASGDLRGDLSVPAFDLSGCTQTQDDVAALMSRLRLITGVTRVSFEDAQKGSAGGAVSSASGSNTCAAHSPSFDLVVFFQALPTAGPDGVVPAGTATDTGATP